MTENNIPSIDITGMTYEQAIKHLKKITPWTDSQIINYVAIVLGIVESDVEENPGNGSEVA